MIEKTLTMCDNFFHTTYTQDPKNLRHIIIKVKNRASLQSYLEFKHNQAEYFTVIAEGNRVEVYVIEKKDGQFVLGISQIGDKSLLGLKVIPAVY